MDPAQFENNFFTETCSGSEAGSNLLLWRPSELLPVQRRPVPPLRRACARREPVGRVCGRRGTLRRRPSAVRRPRRSRARLPHDSPESANHVGFAHGRALISVKAREFSHGFGTERHWHFIAEQPAPAPRTPRRTCCPYAYVLITVRRVSRACELARPESEARVRGRAGWVRARRLRICSRYRS